MSTSSEVLLRFYAGTGTDDRGRRLEDIWRFSLDDLEDSHDYIQWLFPLRERSHFNYAAPVLDDAAVARFRSDGQLRQHLERSLSVMLRFYGLELAGDRVRRASTFTARGPQWLTPGNHNYLRLTRILKSLTILGLRERASALLHALEEIHHAHASIIGPTAIAYWREALVVDDVAES